MPCRLDIGAYRDTVNALLRQVSELARAATDGANLRGAYLLGADLRDGGLAEADVTGADLRAANVGGADLTETLFLSQPQVDGMNGDGATKLPTGSVDTTTGGRRW